MEEYRAVIIAVCVLAYFALCIFVGLWAMKKTKSASDFFVAGRSLGAIVTSVAVFSSVMSGFGFVGGPGLVYGMGVSSFWIVVSAACGHSLCFFLLGRKLREASEKYGAISLPDVVRHRYQSSLAGGLTAIAILLGVVGYLATQILAMATVLQSLTQDVGWLGAEIKIEWCIAFSTAILVFYCVTGGIIASVYTDLVQGIIMVFAAILVFVTAMFAFEGGLAGMSEAIAQDDSTAMSPWGTRGMLGCLTWYFVFTLGICGQPHVVTKLMMVRRNEDVRRALPVNLLGYALTSLLWIGIGLAMRALVVTGQQIPLSAADEAAPVFLNTYANPMLAGVVFAGLFAAIMSTADSFLNIGAAALIHDLPKAFRGKSIERELVWARLATIAVAVVAALFALYASYEKDLVGVLGVFGWGTFAAALAPTIGIGLNWRRATPLAACLAIVSGLAVNLVLKLGKIALPYNIDVGAIALMTSMTLFIAVSLFSTTSSAGKSALQQQKS